MKPGLGEVLIAEGDVEVAEDEERLVESSAASWTPACGPPYPTAMPRGRRESLMVAVVRSDPAGRRTRDLLPARGGRQVGPRGAVLLALAATALVAIALLSDLILPRLDEALAAAPGASQAAACAGATTRGVSCVPNSERGSCCARA